jgi:hypothetical protein
VNIPAPVTDQPRKKLPGWLIAVIVGSVLLGLAICAIVGIGVLTLLGSRVETKVITATDGQSQLTVPGTWNTLRDLNDKAELQTGNPVRDQYTIVLTESKADFSGIDLDGYTELVLDGMRQNMEGASLSSPRELTIGGRPALQHEVRGTVDKTNVVFWVTTVEGTKNYYQVLAWTLASKADDNRSLFEKVITSFREIVK